MVTVDSQPASGILFYLGMQPEAAHLSLPQLLPLENGSRTELVQCLLASQNKILNFLGN